MQENSNNRNSAEFAESQITTQVNGSDFETTKKATKFESVPNNKESPEKSRFKESKSASEMNRFGKT